MTIFGEWECANCGYIHDGANAPPECPECGALAARFVFYAFPDDSDWEFVLEDVIQLTETEERGADA